MADPEVKRRVKVTREEIRGVLKSAERPLKGREIVERIEHPIANGMTACAVGLHCSDMDNVDRTTPKNEAAKWTWTEENGDP